MCLSQEILQPQKSEIARYLNEVCLKNNTDQKGARRTQFIFISDFLNLQLNIRNTLINLQNCTRYNL